MVRASEIPNQLEFDTLFPHHPAGEHSNYDFIVATDSVQLQRELLHGLLTQLAICTMTAAIFSRSICRSARILYMRPRGLIGWCCFIQAMSGIVGGSMGIATTLPKGPTCRATIWVTTIMIIISSMCADVALLVRTYVAYEKDKRFLFAGILLLMLYPGLAVLCLAHTPCLNTVYGCTAVYPSYIPWMRAALDLSMNLLFAGAFLLVAIRHYKKFGLEFWGVMQSDGQVYLVCVVMSNLACVAITSQSLFGWISQMMFIVDCAITSLLLVHQHEVMLATLRLPLESKKATEMVQRESETTE